VSLQERSRTPADDAWAIRVKKRAGWKCEWCGLTIAEIKRLGGELHAAHIKPRSEWPEDALDDSNGKALCTFKDPRHRHPRGIGQGFGCHNSMSGHWGPPTGPTPDHHHAGGFFHRVAVFVLSIPLWWVFVVVDVDLRYYWSFARHFTVGDPQPFLLQLALSTGLWVACMVGIHVALRHRFLSRGARGILHGLVRLARRIRYAKEPQHQG